MTGDVHVHQGDDAPGAPAELASAVDDAGEVSDARMAEGHNVVVESAVNNEKVGFVGQDEPVSAVAGMELMRAEVQMHLLHEQAQTQEGMMESPELLVLHLPAVFPVSSAHVLQEELVPLL